MQISFLSLPDEALHRVFCALSGQYLCDSSSPPDPTWPPHDDATSLGSCCTRLNEIYRTSVRHLSLSRNYSDEDCARLWHRFPSIDSLVFDLAEVPGCSPKEPPRRISGPYPKCMVQGARTIKRVFVRYSGICVRDMQALMESFTGIKSLRLVKFGIHLDRDASEYIDESCTFSLERHAATLERLKRCASAINISLPPSMNGPITECAVDLRWLNLPSLSALKILHFDHLWVSNGSISQLATLTSLQSLALTRMAISDDRVESFLPAMPQLRSLDFTGCIFLTCRVLQWLPPRLDSLNISNIKMLKISPAGEEEFLSYQSSRSSQATRSVKVVVAYDMDCPRFEYLLHSIAGASIEKIVLDDSKLRKAEDLAYLLSKTPRLVNLRLSSVCSFDESVFAAISKLTRLRQLSLKKTDVREEHLVLIGSGPCRYSLRRIYLRGCPEFRHTEATRRRLSSCFDRCDIVW